MVCVFRGSVYSPTSKPRLTSAAAERLFMGCPEGGGGRFTELHQGFIIEIDLGQRMYGWRLIKSLYWSYQPTVMACGLIEVHCYLHRLKSWLNPPLTRDRAPSGTLFQTSQTKLLMCAIFQPCSSHPHAGGLHVNCIRVRDSLRSW